MPSLIITPDISAETCEGATGCARGSQTCNGIIPALVPNPTRPSKKMIDAAAGSIDGACAAQSAKRSEPLARGRSKHAATMKGGAGGGAARAREEQERGNDERGGGVGHHEIGPGGFADARAAMVGQDQREG